MREIILLLKYFSVASRRTGTIEGKYDIHRRVGRRTPYSSDAWKFDRDSPYSGSPFTGIDGIPGFDEDGLPSADILN